MIVVFLGPPGSGKGTQASLLEERHGFYHFDTGSLLREEAASGSELSERIASRIHNGQLVPLEIIDELLRSFFARSNHEKILFDGFPRNMEQAAVLERSLDISQRSLDHVVFFDIDIDRLLERVVNRRVCPECGEIYNMLTDPPKVDGICDVCGHKVAQRRDDTEEVFGNRLQVYSESTLPLLEFYAARGVLRPVSAEGPVEEVFAQIEDFLAVTEGESI